MIHHLTVASSVLASTLRGWRGTSSTTRKVEQASNDLILFDQEGCPSCRMVREAITALNLDVLIMPCPTGGKNLALMQRESGYKTVPVLYDAELEHKTHSADDIIEYLYQKYRGESAPQKAMPNWQSNVLSRAASLSRLNAGMSVRAARKAEKPLTLYSFESSPYSRPVRELLCELELPYQLINLGKQQWSDMGPAKARFTLKPYQPIKHSKREAFMVMYGDVQVPFIVDPNTGIQMFESKDIILYLRNTYALDEI